MNTINVNIDKFSQQLLSKLPIYRLKDLIKAIRACKTAADERAVIQKESAAIRTSVKEENNEARHANVAKLLYIHMLGYPAHFGQMECLKLVASPRFADKRLGYLGIMLLLDENQEVLTLVTNSLKNDMNHSNMYIVGLALCTLGNISSPEMARDLCAEVEKLLGSSNTYIRKKVCIEPEVLGVMNVNMNMGMGCSFAPTEVVEAQEIFDLAALCAVRIIRRVPDLQENFISKAKSLLNDRNHGVLITGITLITEMCSQNAETLVLFRKAVPVLVRHLKNLVTAGFSPEHDVTGVTDPFLQVKILRLLGILGKDDSEVTEAMNDVLAQVATNTESSKNVGNSILYETVLTIMEVPSESGLRVLAVNILGKFLSNRDNNIRYVALETLNKTVTIDTQAVQRHRNIILDCLRDGDISIRRRALELSFALINEQHVRVLTRELLAFLEVADTEFKQSMTTKICLAAERFAPNKRWHIDTVLRVLKLAGNYVREEVLAGFIRLVAQTSELHQYTVQKLYAALKVDISQESLVLAGVWVIGEYGDVLILGGAFEEEELVKEVTETDILTLMNSILQGPYANQVTREYVITALMKLSSRFTDLQAQGAIRTMLLQQVASHEVEIQQRAVEYTNLFGFETIRPAVLERMPVPEGRGREVGVGGVGETDSQSFDRTPLVKQGPSDQDLLMDLMGVGTASSAPAPAAVPTSKSASTPAPPKQNNMDLLVDIFGGPSPTQTSTGLSYAAPSTDAGLLDLLSPAAAAPPAATGLSSLGSLSSALPPTTPPTQQRQSQQGFDAYLKNGLSIRLTPSRDAGNPNVTNITVTFHNDGTAGGSISELLFMAAVPKTQKLQLMPASSNVVAVGGVERQVMRVSNPSQTALKFRLRISYVLPTGTKIDDIAEFSGFPEGSF